MKRILFIIIILSYSISIISQNQRDYLWLFGSNAETLPGIEGSFIDFKNGERDTFYQPIQLHTESNHAIANDLEGNLLFYSNGCKIADADQSLMLNGDSINYGETWEAHCKSLQTYPGVQNTIILPDPGNENGYYMIHKTREIKSDPYLYLDIDLNYSYIDMILNNDKGAVVEKNVQFVPNISNLVNGYLRASKHANGRDWWLIQMKYLDNWYYKILLDDKGISVVDSQQIGPKFTTSTGNSGQAVFSSDGNTWMMYNSSDGAVIYDFDRETAELSNLRQVAIQDSGSFCGVAISPNSRFAYLSSKYDLYQIDLWSNDVQESLVHIAHWDGFGDPYATLFNGAQLAPDCRIYITSTNQTRYLHVINKPNEKGLACDFVQHGFKLPYKHNPASIPNFPHFRIDEEEICDSTISWVPELFLEKSLLNISISPNPAYSEISVDLPEDSIREKWGWKLFTLSGELIKQGKNNNSLEFKITRLDSFAPGIYFIHFRSASGKMGVKKLVIL